MKKSKSTITSLSFDVVFLHLFLFILLTTIIQKASAEKDEKFEEKKIGSALTGRSFFAPNQPLFKRNKFTNKNGGFSIDKENENEINERDNSEIKTEMEMKSDTGGDLFSISDSNNNDSNERNESNSNDNQSIPSFRQSSQLSQSQISSTESKETFLRPLNSNKKIPRVDFQRPWCPGQLLSTIIPDAMDPIYDWTNPLTCQQFADNYGGISVVVGVLDGGTFCSAGPNVQTSAYTIVRGLSTNQPIYAQLKIGVQDFAAAAGPILYPQGLVYYISITKEVAKLPQIC